jgi:hypothetical protein
VQPHPPGKSAQPAEQQIRRIGNSEQQRIATAVRAELRPSPGQRNAREHGEEALQILQHA